MRKVIACLLFVVFFADRSVASTYHLNIDEENEQECKNIAKAAQAFMEFRQGGSSILSVLDSVDSVIKDKDRARISKLIVQDAYSQPTYNTESAKRNQLNSFTAKYYVECMKLIK